MIHVRINRHDPASVDIYVNMPETSTGSQRHSTPLPLNDDQEHIYDRLFDKKPTIRSAQSTIVNQRTHRKHYTLQQILDNVETIQENYEKVVKNRQTSSTLTCFSSWKQWRKSFKHRRRSIKSSSSSSSSSTSSIVQEEIPTTSPFMFGGDTFQWIALPREHSSEHIYENAFLS